MSDIIQDAKQLLSGATPGPWNIDGAPHPGPDDEFFIHPKDDGGVIARVQPLYADAELIADAPELAQALAEETWEYSYQVQNTIGMWEHPTPWPGDPERWWETKEEAEEVAIEAHASGYPIRIVCRRVSPVEVINE